MENVCSEGADPEENIKESKEIGTEATNNEDNKDAGDPIIDKTIQELKSVPVDSLEESVLLVQNPDELKNGTTEKKPELLIDFTVIYNKSKYDIKQFNANNTIKQLKDHLLPKIGVPQDLQKIMIKGLAKDDKTLKELDVKDGSKVMVVGSKLDQILAISSGPSTRDAVSEKATTSKEPFCKQKLHLKVLEKGKPDDIMVGIKNSKDSLPSTPLSGMLNKAGGKVRLTFKLELDQLWIGTKDRTDKVPMNNIKGIVNEPIEGFEEYHIMGFQMGSTEASRYWVYWVPAQYVDAIKSTVLGNWML